MPRRSRPVPLTIGFWLVPLGIVTVATCALLLVGEISALPSDTGRSTSGQGAIFFGLPLLATGVVAVLGAVAVVWGRSSVHRHRRFLQQRMLRIERARTPQQAGVSPGIAGTAHRARARS
jgi:hypothetical protein